MSARCELGFQCFAPLWCVLIQAVTSCPNKDNSVDNYQLNWSPCIDRIQENRISKTRYTCKILYALYKNTYELKDNQSVMTKNKTFSFIIWPKLPWSCWHSRFVFDRFLIHVSARRPVFVVFFSHCANCRIVP
jgi:hypothetical protein